jgi:hypothetical protein
MIPDPEFHFEEEPDPKIIRMPNLRGKGFNGPAYVPALDDARLELQIERVFRVMAFRKWRTLREIEALTGDPPASISAQLRHLRKPRYGSYRVEKQRRGHGKKGLFEYMLLPKPKGVSVDMTDWDLLLAPLPSPETEADKEEPQRDSDDADPTVEEDPEEDLDEK